MWENICVLVLLGVGPSSMSACTGPSVGDVRM